MVISIHHRSATHFAGAGSSPQQNIPSSQPNLTSTPLFQGSLNQPGKRPHAKSTSVKDVLTLILLGIGSLFSLTKLNEWVKPNWENNVEVLASVNQANIAASDKMGGRYTKALIEQLNLPSISSLDEAHHQLEQNGYLGFSDLTYPESRSGSGYGQYCQNSWQKNSKEDNTHRFAFLISGARRTLLDEDSFKRDIQSVQDALNTHFKVPEKQVIVKHSPNQNEVEAGFKELGQLIQQSDAPNPNVMIYCTGHGETDDFSLFDSLGLASSKKGGKTGAILIEPGSLFGSELFTEIQAKKLVKKYIPPKAKVHFIVDTCHSGSWTD